MTVRLENEYKMTMTLIIRNLSAEYFGGYRCIVRNSLGETDGMIRLYGKCKFVFISLKPLDYIPFGGGRRLLLY